jgi:hypothetical protein
LLPDTHDVDHAFVIVLQILFQHAARTNPIAYQQLVAACENSQLFLGE